MTSQTDDPATASRLMGSIAALDRAHPLERKRLVGPDVNHGRELLVSLARRTGGWVGWEATNLRGIAEDLAFLPLAERGRRIANDVTIDALVNRALERAIAAGEVGRSFAALSHGLGFRRVLLDTLLELRTAGVTAAEVRSGVGAGSPAQDIPAVLEQYERLLDEQRLADVPAVFRLALDEFESESRFVLDGVIALVPAPASRGLSRELYDRLLARGAVLLDVDQPHADRILTTGSPVDFFAAATPSDELREVCRRVMAEGLRWDDVEIVATNADDYGIALDALCQRLGVGATMLQGVPLSRTRLGRALDRWLGWLDDGLPADVLRQALEAGDLATTDAGPASGALARELRWLRVGWGRERYEAAIATLGSGRRVSQMRQGEDESDDEFAARRAARERSALGLATLLAALLAITPAVPERGSTEAVRNSCAALAMATSGYLALCAVHGEAEEQTMSRLRERLEDLAKVGGEETTFSSALAALREALADLRAWPMVTSERKPWSAAGGMPHLTTVSHAGTTGRRRIFIVGFDADRTAGPARQDPLLPDAARRSVAPGRLVTSTERREEFARVLSAALASLRGRVTLSYATSATLDGREGGPSPLMLEAWREATGDPGRSYEELRRALRPPASAVPARDEQGGLAGVLPLDARDAWLDALADGALLLDGTSAVCEAFPVLAAGLEAIRVASESELSAFHGLVPSAGAELDPASRPDREISPSSLELLGSCPLAWFYRYGLMLHPTGEPEYDETRWLDALQRGSLLHEVFEQFTREYEDRQDQIGLAAAGRQLADLVTSVVARWRDEVPPPAETVFDAERAELHQAALAFLQMERERRAAGDRGSWLAFELEFGRGRVPGPFILPDGRTLHTHGRVDRVDEMPDGTLRVIDYKTGTAARQMKSPRTGPFNGGRQLQPAIYHAAVEAIMGRPVSSFEYRFPTARGGNETVGYTGEELAAVPALVSSLLAHVHAGEFIATTDAADCSYCNYGEICRAERGRFNATTSPRAAWAKEHGPSLPQYVEMLARRSPAVES